MRRKKRDLCCNSCSGSLCVIGPTAVHLERWLYELSWSKGGNSGPVRRRTWDKQDAEKMEKVDEMCQTCGVEALRVLKWVLR